MKYIASIDGDKYIANMFWFSDTSPIITLRTASKEMALLFDNNEKEEIVVSKYPTVKFLPVNFSIDLQ